MYRKSFIKEYTQNGFSFEEAMTEVDFAADVMFNFTSKDFLLGKTLEDWQLEKLKKIIEQRVKTKQPIQQILGHAYFYNRKFFVNEYTLIPRPETELLVSEVINLSKQFDKPKILDIGTGTGCIPITLCLENNKIIADSVDISEDAIEVAKKNALFHNVYEKTNFIKSDIYQNIKEQYNIIVSNPPYIPLKDKDSLQYEVKNFDPPTALFAKDDLGIDFYDRIIEDIHSYLLPNGYLCFEIGIHQCNEIEILLKQAKMRNIKVIKDYNNIERIIISQK